MGAPRKGQGGSPDPSLDFDINFSHIITVAPRVEIQMHFWKGAKFAGFVGHPMTKNAFSFRGRASPPWPPDQRLCPGPRWGLCPQTPVIGSCSALAMVPPNHWPLPPPMNEYRTNGSYCAVAAATLIPYWSVNQSDQQYAQKPRSA